MGIFLIYIPNMPYTVQMGDTGELVRSAFLLEVIHPPGYPLFIWLIHAVTSFLPFGSVFWRAALATSIISVITCAILFLCLRSKPWLGFAIALTLASSRIFWKFSILPDVFALHGLFVALILFLYLDARALKHQIYIPFIFLIGLSHHLTLIFLAPIIIHIGLKNIKSKMQWLLIAIGLILMMAMYASLMLLHPSNLDSWGNLDSLNAVVLHFLRHDYGTFKLVGTNESGSMWLILTHLAMQTLKSFWVLLIVGFIAFFHRASKHKNFTFNEHIFTFSIGLYVFVFFYLSNIELIGFKIETVERFFIFFHVLLCFWIMLQVLKCEFSKTLKQIVFVVIVSGSAFNILNFYKENDFSKNTIIEDYSINLLNQSTPDKSVILLTMTDTKYGALKYAQTILNVHPEVFIIHPRLLFFEWFLTKAVHNGLIANTEKIIETKNIVIEDDIIGPNLQKFNFLTNLDFQNAEKYKIGILPLGRMLEQGSGINLMSGALPTLLFHSDIKLIKSPENEYDVFREIWTEYAHFNYLKALAILESKQLDFAKAEFLKALDTASWYTPAQQKICEIEAMQNKNISACNQKLEAIQSKYFRYF